MIDVIVYDDKASREKVEMVPKKLKKKLAEEKKAATAASSAGEKK